MAEREKFGSRLGFILVSAGCAVGLGNVWKFPYMAGQYGGAAFILIYLIFLVILGLPIMVCEFAVGRASQKSVASSFRVLEPKGSKFHNFGYFGMIGNYVLMMFYTMVGGWMLYYCYRMMAGEFVGASPQEVGDGFANMLGSPGTMTLWMVIAVLLAFAICSVGLKNGVERITKIMMICLLAIMIVLVARVLTLEGAGEGIKFYLVPDFAKMIDNGIGNVVFGALSQAFFTLSIGIGSMAIFGSYLDKSRSLMGEATSITLLDTFVAIMAGLIVIPACFAFNVEPDSGPGLVFITLPNIFEKMVGGRVWGAFFFLFLSFAALSTIIAVFENIISFAIDLWGWERKKAVLVNIVTVIILSMPCVLGFSTLSAIQPLGAGTNIMDLEDFIVSSNLLPLGSMVYLIFCTSRYGWGWDNFTKEANAGEGIRFPNFIRGYMTYILPILVVGIYLKGYWDKFHSAGWMIVGFAFLAYIGFVSFGGRNKEA
ncbi:sodium-dependent transporter [Sinanaerobacter sp. ZZT-01]|uniref:sodium-dependent transporter n=1 Tax=Sinanaerobacter sp. ZZT-01 TaxID=3111540 RepID=UPI002D76A728|nr:sodium-dependent transporter [Sinanaerobacter sp. ZZT-01]WRR92019.1 sodium-dependent transporter [Sinanaerobacter sp. ZZT-01]